MGLTNNKIRWDHVDKLVKRDSMKTHWRAWGLPEIVDPYTSAFARYRSHAAMEFVGKDSYLDHNEWRFLFQKGQSKYPG